MLGSLWASVEIILGSFLHNLHIPLSGTLLASLGLILMIKGYKMWPEKGLFWRTALVTATMKSFSPSAIILGPMLGIFMEGVLLELFVRGFRGRWPGFILGGALAVSWSLFQKILVLLITFGPDFVKLYENMYFMAARMLQIQGTVPFDLIVFILVIDLSFGGLVAAIAFLSTGSRSRQSSNHFPIRKSDSRFNRKRLHEPGSDNFSLALLGLNVLFIVIGLTYLDAVPAGVASVGTALYIVFNVWRYPRSMRRLKNLRLWVQLIVITLLSALLLGIWDEGSSALTGLLAGYGMVLRALIVIFGFAAISAELRNPRLIDWFKARGLSVLFDALSVAFEVLPALMKRVSNRTALRTHPFRTLQNLLDTLEELRLEHLAQPRVLIFMGSQGSGKTSLLRSVVSECQNEFQLEGIICPGVWELGERDSYDVLNIHTGDSQLLCSRGMEESRLQAGPFFFSDSGIAFGQSVLEQSMRTNPDCVIVDEIGHLELRGLGWASALDRLIEVGQTMIWTVRPSLLDQVLNKWHPNATILDISKSSEEDLLQWTRLFIKTHSKPT